MPGKKKGDDEPDECSVRDCTAEVKRSLSAKRVSKALGKDKLKDGTGKHASLCKEHYKEFKKATKEERMTERLGWE